MAIKIFFSNVIFLVILVSPGFSMSDSDQVGKNELVEKINNNLPSRWKLVETKSGVIPHGHYWGLKYEGPGGLSIVLEGDKDVYLHWKDNKGDWHKEALAKESLELWIMPPDYRESWKRFFIIDKPKSAELLISGNSARVYGYPSHRIGSDERFKEILSHAKSTKWPDSPANKGTLSWREWKEDIKKIMKGEI